MSNLKDNELKLKVEKAVKLLKFSLSIDDPDLLKSTIDSIIDMLEEELN